MDLDLDGLENGWMDNLGSKIVKSSLVTHISSKEQGITVLILYIRHEDLQMESGHDVSYMCKNLFVIFTLWG